MNNAVAAHIRTSSQAALNTGLEPLVIFKPLQVDGDKARNTWTSRNKISNSSGGDTGEKNWIFIVSLSPVSEVKSWLKQFPMIH